MREIILKKRYPHSREEDITDAFMRGYVKGKADRPQGEWEEKTKFHNADDDPIIEEWQSTKCSVCGKYHTTPYLYYFNDYNYCPNCGARMFVKDINVPNKKGADDE